jgi:uncharacterized protein YkwD
LDEELGAAKSPAKADGRLCAHAEALLGWDRPDQPDEWVNRFLSWYFGWTSIAPSVQIATIETEDPRPIAERLREAIVKFSGSASQPRFGVATQLVRKGATKLVLVIDDAPVEVDPVPRRLELGQQATLTGQFQGPYSKPKVLVSDADGKTQKPVASDGKTFHADLRCGAHSGNIVVLIRGESDEGQGERSLADFPVACGIALPTSVALNTRDQGSSLPLAEQEKKIFEQINVERTTAGLKPLVWDESLARVARTASEKRGADPNAAGSVDIGPLLKGEGISSPMVLENPGRAQTGLEAQTRFSFSPSHRSNFMNPEVTKAAVGLATAKDPSGQSSVFISEIFLQELPPVDVRATREKIAAAIARRRSDARAPTMQKDTTLDDIAQQYAKELAASQGTMPKAKGNELLVPAQKRFKKINVLSGARTDPTEFAEEPSIVSDAKLYGIGVAQGAHPTLGTNAVYVVVLLGTRR